jgi:hypothetical protein
MAIGNISRHSVDVSTTPVLIPWKDDFAEAITYSFEPNRAEDIWLVHDADDTGKTRGLMVPAAAGGDECVQRGTYEANSGPRYLVSDNPVTILVTVIRIR